MKVKPMSSRFNNQIKLLIAITSILLLGTFGYYFIEDDWTLFESFYMTVISITTVGYGETKPLSDLGRVFTIVLIFIGIGTAVSFLGELAKNIIENNFNNLYGGKRMKREIEKLSGHYIICGFGDIGSSICSSLYESHIPFVLIEDDKKSIDYATRREYLVVEGQSVYDTTLIEAGIKRAKGIVICLGDDSINMHVSLAAREINPEIFIIARGYKSFIEKRMVRAGANSVVNPLKLGGEQIAELISKQYSEEENEDFVQHKSSVMGFALRLYQHFQENPMKVVDIRERMSALQVLKYRDSHGDEIENPSSEQLVKQYETVLLLVNEGEQSDIKSKLSLFEWSNEYSTTFKMIDDEHKKLFELVNNFVYALNMGRGKESLAKTFDDLLDYTVVHFEHEETFFRKHKYPEEMEHCKEHKELIDKLIKLNKNKRYIFPENVADFLFSWLKDHILGSDMRYVKYLRENDIDIDK